ncbi:MAG: hypothetical protein PHU23_18565 [Dehalococcoidales bacterium]|nr:hypothetical protein [Dehalococcoidales bacterium]
MKIIHIYDQPFEHSDARILGNREGLTSLRDAIDRALAGEKVVMGGFDHKNLDSQVLHNAEDVIWATDGEGYELHVECNDSDWMSEFWNRDENKPYYYSYMGDRS